jgi:ATP-dependent DNA helicase RecQ
MPGRDTRLLSSQEEDDLEAAIQELGEEYTEEEIRLMRIKFLSSWSR